MALVLVTGIAVASDDSERYQEADDLLTKAIAVLNATTPINKAESKQRNAAIKSLTAGQLEVECALLRESNPKAVCP